MPTLRTFVALPLDNRIVASLQDLHHQLTSLPVDVKWVKPQSIHVTIKFIGNVDEQRIDPVCEAIQRGVAGVRSWPVEVKKVGTFPGMRNPRVVWVGLDDPKGNIKAVQHHIEDELAKIGFEKERRPFTPHLTVGRVRSSKGKKDLVCFLLDEREREFGEMEIDRVLLFKSDLKPTGAVYTVLKEFMF